MCMQVASGNIGFGNGYGLSKAALSALTIIQGNKHPNLKVVSLSPGFIDTPMTKGCFMSSECTLSVTIRDENGPPFLWRMSHVYRHARCANRLRCTHAQIRGRARTHTRTSPVTTSSSVGRIRREAVAGAGFALCCLLTVLTLTRVSRLRCRLLAR